MNDTINAIMDISDTHTTLITARPYRDQLVAIGSEELAYHLQVIQACADIASKLVRSAPQDTPR